MSPRKGHQQVEVPQIQTVEIVADAPFPKTVEVPQVAMTLKIVEKVIRISQLMTATGETWMITVLGLIEERGRIAQTLGSVNLNEHLLTRKIILAVNGHVLLCVQTPVGLNLGRLQEAVTAQLVGYVQPKQMAEAHFRLSRFSIVDLRHMARLRGVDSCGLQKPELIEQLLDNEPAV